MDFQVRRQAYDGLPSPSIPTILLSPSLPTRRTWKSIVRRGAGVLLSTSSHFLWMMSTRDLNHVLMQHSIGGRDAGLFQR